MTSITAVTEEHATWLCVLCGWMYDEEAGDAATGIAPGTRWVDVPDSWTCPDCGVMKAQFEMVQI